MKKKLKCGPHVVYIESPKITGYPRGVERKKIKKREEERDKITSTPKPFTDYYYLTLLFIINCIFLFPNK